MKEAVIIKSFPNGIALYLNPELPFESVLEEIGYKFADARNFFGSATMALSIEGRTVTDMEEIRILEAIRDNSGLNIACIVEKDDTVNQSYVKALERTERELAKNRRVSSSAEACGTGRYWRRRTASSCWGTSTLEARSSAPRTSSYWEGSTGKPMPAGTAEREPSWQRLKWSRRESESAISNIDRTQESQREESDIKYSRKSHT